MTNTKMTNRKALEYVLENCKPLPIDVVEKLEKMIVALDRKNTSDRKPTSKQVANAAVLDEIVNYISDHPCCPSDEGAERGGWTCSELIQAVPALAGKSSQYVSALMRQAVEAGRVSKFTHKRQTLFTVTQ